MNSCFILSLKRNLSSVLDMNSGPLSVLMISILPNSSIAACNDSVTLQVEKRFLKNSVFIDWNEVKEVTKKIIQEYNVAAQNEDISIRRLSGGNIQKVIIGRAFVSPINLLVTHNPTSGLDKATVEFIFNKTRGNEK